ncbi:1,2-dihydroxy-3-keto-5-methylthiopentene dioxygenase [Dispira parvispora]|uniref:1,2-dihydroxy-3-keto-5-methylthiopentene dioxygenase n=1 Tax=Dispira parvispora TaxID=1520584 RepID=A0A9W8E963_9FUNG|nr:1,2-dihydroxy-3-keto-5-methylthiopentene dioxygenase [Dispira parvispora]
MDLIQAYDSMPPDSSATSPPAALTFSRVLHYLQAEWRRFDLERNEWHFERQELLATIQDLEQSRKDQEQTILNLQHSLQNIEKSSKQQSSQPITKLPRRMFKSRPASATFGTNTTVTTKSTQTPAHFTSRADCLNIVTRDGPSDPDSTSFRQSLEHAQECFARARPPGNDVELVKQLVSKHISEVQRIAWEAYAISPHPPPPLDCPVVVSTPQSPEPETSPADPNPSLSQLEPQAPSPADTWPPHPTTGQHAQGDVSSSEDIIPFKTVALEQPLKPHASVIWQKHGELTEPKVTPKNLAATLPGRRDSAVTETLAAGTTDYAQVTLPYSKTRTKRRATVFPLLDSASLSSPPGEDQTNDCNTPQESSKSPTRVDPPGSMRHNRKPTDVDAPFSSVKRFMAKLIPPRSASKTTRPVSGTKLPTSQSAPALIRSRGEAADTQSTVDTARATGKAMHTTWPHSTVGIDSREDDTSIVDTLSPVVPQPVSLTSDTTSLEDKQVTAVLSTTVRQQESGEVVPGLNPNDSVPPTDEIPETPVEIPPDEPLPDASVTPSHRHDITSLWTAYPPLQGHLDPVRAIDLDPASLVVVSASDDGVIKIWDLQRPPSVVGHRGHRKHHQLCYQPIFNLRGSIHQVTSVAYAPSQRRCFSGGTEGSVRVWELPADFGENHTAAGLCFNTLKLDEHQDIIWDMCLHPRDHSLLATASADGTCRVWDTANLTQQSVAQFGYTAPEWHNDGTSLPTQSLVIPSAVCFTMDPCEGLAVGYCTSSIRLYDLTTRTCVNHVNLTASDSDPSAVNQLTVIPSDRLLAAGMKNGTVLLVDLRSCQIVHTIRGHYQGVTAVDVDFSGQCLVTASNDCSLRWWDRRMAWSCSFHQEAHRPKNGEGIVSMKAHPTFPWVLSGGADGIVKPFAAVSPEFASD